ncbi:MAG: esterase [Bacilli bacterium]|nr:esterase [Bacilli bacterium]
MEFKKFNNTDSNIVLVQLVDSFELNSISKEIEYIKEQTSIDFCFLVIKVNNWNDDLSPWKMDAVIGKESFGGLSDKTLKEVLNICNENKTYILGGYSLSALFALWASYNTDRFIAIASSSPSLWFKDFTKYMKENHSYAKYIYLSLGDKEDKTRNEILSSISKKIKEAYECLKPNHQTILEFNSGNHFQNVEERVAKGFIWAINKVQKSRIL